MFKKLTAMGNDKLKTTSPATNQPGKAGTLGKQQPGKQAPVDPKAAEKDIKPTEKELSSEEKLALIEIKPIEKKALDRAFERLCGATSAKDHHDDFSKEYRKEEDFNQKKGVGAEDDTTKKYFTAEDVAKVLEQLEYNASKPEIDLMIWEVDENLDKKVDRAEFDLMFRRCIEDETGLEPKSLFNLAQFLMYAQKDSIKITEEDTLELIYVRKNSIKGLEDALKIIFGEEERRIDGIEKTIGFTEFLDRRNKRALKLRRDEKQAKKDARSTLKKKEDL